MVIFITTGDIFFYTMFKKLRSGTGGRYLWRFISIITEDHQFSVTQPERTVLESRTCEIFKVGLLEATVHFMLSLKL